MDAPLWAKPTAVKGLCSEPLCENPEAVSKKCQPHYTQWVNTKTTWPLGSKPGNVSKKGPCAIPMCDRRAKYFDKCDKHHQSYRRGVLSEVPTADQCILPWCKAFKSSTGLCYAHNNKAKQFSLDPDRMRELAGDGTCGICRDDIQGKDAHIDHDHACCPGTGSCGECVRGFLCRNCNVGLGFLNDSPDRLIQALNYLNDYEQRH